MKETSVIKTRASAPLKQEVQPSVTMWKKKARFKEWLHNCIVTTVTMESLNK